MLALNLGKIRSAHERFEQVYAPEALGQDRDEYRVVAPAALAFDIYKDKRQFRLVGRVQTGLELTCGRCLEPFTMPVDAEFDLRTSRTLKIAAKVEREIEEDDLTTAFYEHDEIDLGQLMREQFYLTLPMKPLCANSCKGLCSVCGTNRNRATCTCNPHWEDPRLSALNALKATKRES